MESEVFENVRDSLAEQLDIDPEKITMDSNIVEDFDADSLDVVEMIMSLEDEYDIKIPDEVAEELRTVGDVVKYVEENT